MSKISEYQKGKLRNIVNGIHIQLNRIGLKLDELEGILELVEN